MKSMITLAALVLLAGCAAKQVTLNPGAEAVKLGKEDPAPGFEYVGEVSGVSGHGCGLYGSPGSFGESAKAIRNEAQMLGADYIQIMAQTKPGPTGGQGSCYRNTYQIDGTAYKAPR